MAAKHVPEQARWGFLQQPVSRRRLLRGLAALTSVGTLLPLAAACAPAPPVATTAPTQQGAAGKPAGTPAPAGQPSGELKKGGSLKVAILGELGADGVEFELLRLQLAFDVDQRLLER